MQLFSKKRQSRFFETRGAARRSPPYENAFGAELFVCPFAARGGQADSSLSGGKQEGKLRFEPAPMLPPGAESTLKEPVNKMKRIPPPGASPPAPRGAPHTQKGSAVPGAPVVFTSARAGAAPHKTAPGPPGSPPRSAPGGRRRSAGRWGGPDRSSRPGSGPGPCGRSA